MDDLPGYLEAFGSPVRVKGVEYSGILEDDYNQVEMGRVKVASNAPQLLFANADVRKMSLTRGDSVSIKNVDLGTWATYVVRSIQQRTDGFSLVLVIEST